MDRAVLILSALLLNATLAGPRQWYAPLKLSRLSGYPALLLRAAERKLNREHRSLEDRQWRGIALAAMVVGISFIAGCLGGWILRYNLHFVELVLLASLLPVRQTWDIVSQVHKALKSGNVQQARSALEGTVWKHHVLLDEFGVARAAIELLAVQFSEKILAPVLWYLLFGLPGLFICRAVYLMVETLFQPVGSIDGFSKAAKQLHFVLNYIPGRLAVLLWLSALLFLPSSKPSSATNQILAGDLLGGSPQSVSVLTAASCLSVTLGGPTSVYTSEKWLGAGTAKATALNVRSALYLYALLQLLLFILVGFFL